MLRPDEGLLSRDMSDFKLEFGHYNKGFLIFSSLIGV